MNSGFINLNKPKHWSSHDCVARVRRLLNTKKVGHGGTLDPLATGVLPIAVGRATRLIQYLRSQKAYRATVRFGLTTTTDDLEGDILTQQGAAHLQLSDIEALLPRFTGMLSQVPPMFSAVQVDGKRLYALARKGQQVQVPEREVMIHQLTVVDWQPSAEATETPELVLDVDCGPGTYIRSLARDLGVAVGTGATLAGLVRTHSNGFELAESMTLDEIETAIAQDTFQPVAAGHSMRHLPAIALPHPLAKRFCMGQKLALADIGLAEGIGLAEDIGLADIGLATMEADPEGTVPASAATHIPLRILCEQAFLGIGEIRVSNYGEPDSEPTGLTHHILAPKRVFAPL